jgi:4-amino-4-deoxy-L-arabinose transferase-like glycosyltransferase
VPSLRRAAFAIVGISCAAGNALKRSGRTLPPVGASGDEAPEPDRDPSSAASVEGTLQPGSGAEARHTSRWPRFDARARREIILALALLFCYGFFRQVPAWNEYSRYDLVRALVEDGTTRIDRYQENTGDKAFYGGHYYSDKAPGTALIGVPVYLLLTATFNAAGAGTPDPLTAVQALAFVESGIFTVLLVLLLLRFLRPAVGERWALVVSLGYGLGSIAFPFATMFFGHAASAFFLFAAFYVLWRAKTVEGRRWMPALAGFLAGLAVLVELSVMLGVVVLLAYALGVTSSTARWPSRADLRAPALMVAGAAIPAAMLLSYNWVSFGGPFSLGYGNLASGGFAEGMSRGILGVTWPRGEVLVELLVGPRGLLRLAPWFLLAPVGLLAARRTDLRPEVLVCGVIVVAYLAFNAGYYMPFGGWTPGPASCRRRSPSRRCSSRWRPPSSGC